MSTGRSSPAYPRSSRLTRAAAVLACALLAACQRQDPAVWSALKAGTYAADVPINAATLHTRTAFFDTESGDKGMITEGHVGSLALTFVGSAGRITTSGDHFEAAFSVSIARRKDGQTTFEPAGKVIVSGTFDPPRVPAVKRLRYREVFSSAAGMDYELTSP
jgi:hypothetical protein